MKHLVILLTGTFLLLLVNTGCQPKLAQSPYGPKEQQWEDVIKDAFPDWDPPHTTPPERVLPAASEKTEAPKIISEDDVVINENPSNNNEPLIDNAKAEKNIQSTEEAVTAEFQTYKVQKGDTLWKISRKFYGTGKSWKKIFKANQDILSAPDKVKAGIELRIPAKQ